MKIVWKMAVVVACVNLTACSMLSSFQNNGSHPVGIGGTTVDRTGTPVELGAGMKGGALVGGSIAAHMDESDKTKLSRALDKAPGTETTWVNDASGTGYTVLPIKKVTIRDNPFCREYHVTAVKGNDQQEANGTACITSDGNWHTIS